MAKVEDKVWKLACLISPYSPDYFATLTDEYRQKYIDAANRVLAADISAEVVICAAVKTKCGRTIRCHRHSDGIQVAIHNGWSPLQEPGAQGFITSKNRFVGRVEAKEIQLSAGIKSFCGDYRGEKLYSEDLY